MTTPVGVLNGNWKGGDRLDEPRSTTSFERIQRGNRLINEYRDQHGNRALLKLYEDCGRDFDKMFIAIENLVVPVPEISEVIAS